MKRFKRLDDVFKCYCYYLQVDRRAAAPCIVRAVSCGYAPTKYPQEDIKQQSYSVKVTIKQ